MSSAPEGRQGGARALLYTVLGEFVLPAGGAVWTSTVVAALAQLDVTEKNARQALARVADQGTIAPERHGRETRWVLTARGHRLLETGARRIYEFGTVEVGWTGEWLVAHCPVPETQRALRHQLRAQLAFEGFGELAASLAVSPHVEREPSLRRIIADLGLDAESLVLRSRTGSPAEDAELVHRAWDLGALADAYHAFGREHRNRRPIAPEARFAAVVELVHDWRRFPSIDPELPTALLPPRWAGATAAATFHECRDRWRADAADWFAAHEASHLR